MIRSILLVLLLAPALVVVGASSALACSCVPSQADDKAVKSADAVFAGTVIDTEDGVDIGFDEVTWTFAVDTVYKGDVEATHEITSPTQSAACGVILKEQERYVVFAYADEEGLLSRGDLMTNSCMNTRELKRGQDVNLERIRAFEGPVAVEDRQEDYWGRLWPSVLPASLFLVVAATVFLSWRLRRRSR